MQRPGTSAAEQGRIASREHRRASVRLLLLVVAAALGSAVALGMVVMVRIEAIRYLFVVLVAVIAVLAWRGRPRPDPQRWLRGAAGEVATAALLDGLSRYWVVRHDVAVPGARANIDHVVIGPTGVWVIDTKAYRARLRVGWASVHAGDHRLDTAPVTWEASVVADRLETSVRPLVAVHGTGLPSRGRRVGGVRVLPASEVVRHLRGKRRWGVGAYRTLFPRLRRSQVDRLAGVFDAAFGEANWQDAALVGRSARGRRR